MMVTTNHECYVDLEVAKLLKKAGFDWEVNHSYPDCDSLDNSCSGYMEDLSFYHNLNDGKYGGMSVPTLDVAQRWLREVKNIDVVASRAMQWKQFYYTIAHEENRTSKIDFMSLNEDLWWFKYEEALEAGIKKALEIILENGE